MGFRITQAMGIFQGRGNIYTHGHADAGVAQKTIPGIGTVKHATGHDIKTEVDYLQLERGERSMAEIATIPREIYPEIVAGGITRYSGADYPHALFEPSLRPYLKTHHRFIFGLGNDEIGYLIPKAEWDSRPSWLQNRNQRWHGEINSVGPDVAGIITRALVRLIEEGTNHSVETGKRLTTS